MVPINSGCAVVVVFLALALLPIFFSLGAGKARPIIVVVLLALSFVVLFGFASFLSVMSVAGAGESGLGSVIVSFNFVVIGPLWGAIVALSLSRRPKRAIVAGVFAWLLSAGCASFLGAGIYTARCSARRSHCSNNLKQIGLALHSYHEMFGSFPPAYTVDENGKPMHSWRVLILPFMEYSSLYNSYDRSEPWNGPHNSKVCDMMLPEFCCPTDASRAKGEINYLAVVGDETAWPGPRGSRLSEIRNGPSKTIMVVEVVNPGINWTEPRDLSFADMDFHINGQPGRSISSHHTAAVANVLFADGSVRSLPQDLSPEELRAMLTIKGGEKAPPNGP